MKKLFLMGVILILVACSTDAPLKISNMWARPGKIDGTSAAYFEITNTTNLKDRLLRVESDIAEKCEIHMTSIDKDNKMTMLPQEFIQIPAREKVDFMPGGLHVMIMNLKTDLVSGEKIHLTLQFEKAGKVALEVPVKE